MSADFGDFGLATAYDDAGVFELEGFEERAASLNRPSLPEGRYLAAFTGGYVYQYNQETGAAGFKMDFVINPNPDAVKEGWDFGVKPVKLTRYMFAGYRNGNTWDVQRTKNGNFMWVNLLVALGQKTKNIDLSKLANRQFVIDVVHKRDNNAPPVVAGEEDTARYFLDVSGVSPYQSDGTIAPTIDLSRIDDTAAAGAQF